MPREGPATGGPNFCEKTVYTILYACMYIHQAIFAKKFDEILSSFSCSVVCFIRRKLNRIVGLTVSHRSATMADDSFSSSSEGWDAKAVADDDEDVQPGVSLSPAKRTGSKPNSETPNSAKKRKHDKGSAVGQSSKQLSRKRAKTGPHPRISAVDEAMKKFLSSLGTNVALCNIAGASPSVFHKIVEAAELTPLETAIVQTEFLKQKSALKSNPNTPVRSPNSMTSSADPLSTRFNAHSRPAQRKPERKQQGQARQEFSGKKNQVGKVASNAAKPSTATAGSVSSKTAKPSTAGAEKQERKRQQSLTAMRSATPKGAEDSLTEVVVLNLPFDCKEPQVKNFLGSAGN